MKELLDRSDLESSVLPLWGFTLNQEKLRIFLNCVSVHTCIHPKLRTHCEEGIGEKCPPHPPWVGEGADTVGSQLEVSSSKPSAEAAFSVNKLTINMTVLSGRVHHFLVMANQINILSISSYAGIRQGQVPNFTQIFRNLRKKVSAFKFLALSCL